MCQNLRKQTKSANLQSWNSKPKLNLYRSLKTHQNPMNIIFLQNVKLSRFPCKNHLILGRRREYFSTIFELHLGHASNRLYSHTMKTNCNQNWGSKILPTIMLSYLVPTIKLQRFWMQYYLHSTSIHNLFRHLVILFIAVMKTCFQEPTQNLEINTHDI
jgi:hypothetical protein